MTVGKGVIDMDLRMFMIIVQAINGHKGREPWSLETNRGDMSPMLLVRV